LKLNENKLSRLFSELKILDKEHLALKRLKADNGDKDGLREAEIRKKVKKPRQSKKLIKSYLS
jgi:hypothetical protein